MSTVSPEAASTTGESHILFDYPGADIILCSRDSHHFRVPKNSIINNSPVLGELIRRTLDSLGNPNVDVPLPVVPLPESGEILCYLLTFIFPVVPVMPSNGETIELLSVAQKYKMETVLIHIRGSIARQNPLPTRLEPALRTYALAQKYGLRPEALQTARTILKYSMTIQDLDNKLGIMPSAYLYELWKYHERVRTILASDLKEFRESGARGTITSFRCTELTSSQIPRWLDRYIESLAKSPKLFDSAEFNIAMARHIKNEATLCCSQCGDIAACRGCGDDPDLPYHETHVWCECESIPSQIIRDFWQALESVVHGSLEKVRVIVVFVSS